MAVCLWIQMHRAPRICSENPNRNDVTNGQVTREQAPSREQPSQREEKWKGTYAIILTPSSFIKSRDQRKTINAEIISCRESTLQARQGVPAEELKVSCEVSSIVPRRSQVPPRATAKSTTHSCHLRWREEELSLITRYILADKFLQFFLFLDFCILLDSTRESSIVHERSSLSRRAFRANRVPSNKYLSSSLEKRTKEREREREREREISNAAQLNLKPSEGIMRICFEHVQLEAFRQQDRTYRAQLRGKIFASLHQ